MRIIHIGQMTTETKKHRLEKLSTIYVLFIAYSLLAFLLIGYYKYPDSASYFNAWKDLMSGELPGSRTPVYPVFLGLVQSVFSGKAVLWAVVILQTLVFACSIHCFYRLASSLVDSERWAFYLTLFYALFPGINSWNLALLTESLSVSMMVFMLYSAMRVVQDKSLRWVLVLVLWVLLLTFIRPSFLYVLPVVGVMALVMMRQKGYRRLAAWALAGMVAVGALLLSYCWLFNQQHGIFSPSRVGVVNQYFIARQYGIMDPKAINDKDFREYMIQRQQESREATEEEIWEEIPVVFKTFSFHAISQGVNASNAMHRDLQVKALLGRMQDAEKTFAFMAIEPMAYSVGLIGVNLGTIILFLLVYLCVVAYKWWKRREVNGWGVFLWMIISSNIFVSVVGAQSAWNRLNMPVMPALLLLLGITWMVLRKNLKHG